MEIDPYIYNPQSQMGGDMHMHSMQHGYLSTDMTSMPSQQQQKAAAPVGMGPQVVVSFQAPYRIQHVNKEWLDLMGFSAAQATGRSLGLIQGPSTNVMSINAMIKEAHLDNVASTTQTALYTREGRCILMRITAVPVQSGPCMPETCKIYMQSSDSVPLKIGEADDGRPKAVLSANAPHLIQSVTPSFLDIYGVCESHIIGRTIHFIHGPRTDMLRWNSMVRGALDGVAQHQQIWTCASDCSDILVGVVMSPATNADHQVTHILVEFLAVTSTQITPQKQIVKQMYFDRDVFNMNIQSNNNQQYNICQAPPLMQDIYMEPEPVVTCTSNQPYIHQDMPGMPPRGVPIVPHYGEYRDRMGILEEEPVPKMTMQQHYEPMPTTSYPEVESQHTQFVQTEMYQQKQAQFDQTEMYQQKQAQFDQTEMYQQKHESAFTSTFQKLEPMYNNVDSYPLDVPHCTQYQEHTEMYRSQFTNAPLQQDTVQPDFTSISAIPTSEFFPLPSISSTEYFSQRWLQSAMDNVKVCSPCDDRTGSTGSTTGTNSSTTIFPRRKAGQSKKDGQGPVLITLDVLESMADVSLSEAVRKLGVSSTAIKKACRKLGVLRWPYRKNQEVPRPAEKLSHYSDAYVRKLYRKYSTKVPVKSGGASRSSSSEKSHVKEEGYEIVGMGGNFGTEYKDSTLEEFWDDNDGIDSDGSSESWLMPETANVAAGIRAFTM